MIKKLLQSIRFQKNFKSSVASIKQIEQKYDLNDWYFSTMIDYNFKPNIQFCIKWLLKNIKEDDVVYEAGCGIAANLLYLRLRKKFTPMAGDLVKKNIQALEEIFQSKNIAINTRVEDSTHPQSFNQSINFVISLNWHYLIENFNYDDYLKNLSDIIDEQRGFVILDVVDAEYDTWPNNEYNIHDWELPELERRKSQYQTRIAKGEFLNLCKKHNFELVETFEDKRRVFKRVYILKKIDSLHIVQ